MKWMGFIFLAFCLQSTMFFSSTYSVRLEDNSIYFEKGEYKEFLNNKLARIREIQLEYPEIVFEFSLFQLESEPRYLAEKRYKTLIKSFWEAGLDMNRIVFESRTFFVENFKDHLSSFSIETIDSVGAILEGKVLSLE